jgi:DNA-directed RNA polymerase specialized sigma24 family protein
LTSSPPDAYSHQQAHPEERESEKPILMDATDPAGAAGAAGQPRDDRLRVLDAIAKQRRMLDAAERDVLERARREGLTLAEIGTFLGISRQAVHARLRRLKNAPLIVVPLAGYDELLNGLLDLPL